MKLFIKTPCLWNWNEQASRSLVKRTFGITYKGVLLPHLYQADFVIWDQILFEAKAAERLSDAHIKQVLNYIAASKLQLGLLVNFGGDSLEWKRIVMTKREPRLVDLRK